MKKVFLAVLVLGLLLTTNAAMAHDMYVKKNPTNESGIEFGVNNASGFVRWRAYAKGLSNNLQGQNTGWKDAGNGWWYYDLTSINQRVMWRLDGLSNQKFMITYWVFRSDNTWDYGPQVEVTADDLLPDAQFVNVSDATVYYQNPISIKVASGDNLSGVDSLRIYAVTPADNCALSGWLPSGINNQYYKEFSATSIDYNLTAPCEGLYTLTLWARDKAGNIAYEPHGPITIALDLPAPPPEILPPASPSNFKAVANNKNVNLSWQYNATAEDGFKLYRNEQFLASLAAEALSYSDLNLEYGKVYTYRLFAYKGQLNSEAQEVSITLTELSVEDYRYAASFMYPLACDKIYRWEQDTKIPTGACYDYQPFGSIFAYPAKCHNGSDLNLRAVNDLGAPLYAIGNALLWDFGWVDGWGNFLILRIQSGPDHTFILSDGTTVSEIFVLYAHLDEIRVIKKDDGSTIEKNNLVKRQTWLKKGWQIGTVGDGGGIYSPHLHFEIRINGYDQLGHGYTLLDDSSFLTHFVDPLEFIDNNMTMDAPFNIIVHSYDRISSRSVYLNFNPSLWQRQARLYEGLPLAAVGWSNYIWTTDSDNYTLSSWDFKLPVDGTYAVYVMLPRNYGQAKGIHYEIWHSSPNYDNPYAITLDQTNNDLNQKVYLGSFEFKAGPTYSIGQKILPTDYPVEKVALDSLILAYEGELGIGGGPALPPEDGNTAASLQTLTCNGSLTFEYQGTYSSPRLICYGLDLEKKNPIFDNGIVEATVGVIDSGSVYCNVEFEDGQWIGAWYGIMPDQHLFVDGVEITTALDNHQGGTNLVFNLIVDPNSGDTIIPPIDDGDTSDGRRFTIDVNVKGDVSGLGCRVSDEAMDRPTASINYLIILSPGLLMGLSQITRRLKKRLY
ncbi:MAG: hypothetical protein NTZ49_05680 [Candidatus Parcubacteria bacterium]|nr:hypothetical protein [Candidatus Parcubacteria bacterium]